MSHAITLEIPENAYEALIQQSVILNKRPEEIAAEVLADSLTDPLLQLAGCIQACEREASGAEDEAFGMTE